MRPNIRSTAFLHILACMVLAAGTQTAFARKKSEPTPPAGFHLADFDNPDSLVSGLLRNLDAGYPTIGELDRSRNAGNFTRWARVVDDRFFRPEEMGGNSILFEGVRGGEFTEMRVVFEVREDDNSNNLYFNMGCLLTLPAAPGGAQETPSSALARVGLELREPFVFWEELGVLHATSREKLYAVLHPGADGPRLIGLFRAAHDEAVFDSMNCYRVGLFETDGVQLLTTDARLGSSWWRRLFEAAAAAGLEGARRAIEKSDAVRNGAASEALAGFDAVAEDAPLSEQCAAFAELYGTLKRNLGGEEQAKDAMARPAAKLVAAYDRALEAARGDNDTLGMEILGWLRGELSEPDHASLAQLIGEHAWVHGWLERMRGKTFEQALAMHVEAAKEAGAHPSIAPEFITRARRVSADAAGRMADFARFRRLHATAALSYFIQSSLLDTDAPRDSTELLRYVASSDPGQGRPEQLALIHAKKSAVELLKEVYPFVGKCSPSLEEWLDDNPVGFRPAEGARIFSSDCIALDLGRRDAQTEFAEANGIPLVSVNVLPTQSIDFSLDITTEERTGEVTETNRQSNNEAVQLWLDQVNSLAAHISAANDQIAGARSDSGHVSGTETWQTTNYADGYHVTTTTTFETMRSAIARIRAMGRAEDITEERDRLQKEYDRLMARRPPEERTEYRTRTVRCLIEWQNWTLKYTLPVRIEGGPEAFEESYRTTLTSRLPRCPETRELGIARTDGWRTEEDLRADEKFTNMQHPKAARAALQDYLQKRINAYLAELEERGVSPEDRAIEEACLNYLLVPWSREAKDTSALAVHVHNASAPL